MSIRVGREILSNQNRWELDAGASKYVIYIETEGYFRVSHLKADGEEWYLDGVIDNSLWFKSYTSARTYCHNEMYVEGTFKKVKSR